MHKFRWTLSAATSWSFVISLVLASGLLILVYTKPFFGPDKNSKNVSFDAIESPAHTSFTATSSGMNMISVHVAGEIVHPGVYSLEAGSRVNNAIIAAGGFKPLSDTNSVNLAELLRDGQKIVVLPKDSQSSPVNINTADAQRLQSIKGIGKATAKRIIDWRNKHGPFKRLEDLKKISGIGNKLIKSIKDKVIL